MSDKYVFERATMEDLADSVRSVVGTSEGMTASEMSSELSNFSTGVGEAITNQDTLIAQINAAIEGKSAGGVVLPELNNPASAENIDSGYEVVDGEGNLLTGTSTKVQLPTLSNAANAAQILSGYEAILENGSKVTGTISSQAAQTITPGTADKTIAAGNYLSGTQTIKGDANLIAANILSGKSIFGVAGSVVSQSVVTGTVNGSNTDTIYIPAIVGKSNFILIANYDSYNGYPYTRTVMLFYLVNGVKYGCCWQVNNYNAGINYGPSSYTINEGRIQAGYASDGYTYHFNMSTYYYIAW